MRLPVARARRTGSFRRWLGLQIAVAVIAAFGVSLMFAGGSPPAPVSVSNEGGKSVRRVAHDAAADGTVVQFDAQQQAALAAIASFTPTAAPAVVSVPPAARAAKEKTAVVSALPPRRPQLTPAAAPAALPGPAPIVEADTAPVPPTPQNWRIVGMDIPGSGRVRRFIPSGSDLLKPADAAWTASKNAVKKVASFGELFGL